MNKPIYGSRKVSVLFVSKLIMEGAVRKLVVEQAGNCPSKGNYCGLRKLTCCREHGV